MSLNRITVAQKIISSSKKVGVPNLLRVAQWQSTGASAGSLKATKVLVYGVTTAGVVVGSSLVYANYNPSFRYKVDEYIPRFASLADRAADKWIEVVDRIKPKQSDKVSLKKEIEKTEGSEKSTPSVVVSAPTKENGGLFPSKELSAKESAPKVSESQSSNHETSAVKDTPPSKESSKESTNVTTGESVPSSRSQVVSVQNEKDSSVVDEKDQAEPVAEAEVLVAPVEVGVETPVIEEPTGENVDKETEESPPTADRQFKDATQAEKQLQEVYKKYREFDNRTYELYKVLMQAEKLRQEKLAQAMKVDTDNKTTMQSIAEDVAKADEEVQNAEEKVAASQVQTTEVGKELASLLNRASDLGLKSKVEAIRIELSQLHTRAMMGAVDYAEEKLYSDMMKEYQLELKKAKDWIKSELGTTLPEASSQQEAVILMLQKRMELLLQKFEEAEKEYQHQLAAALLKQKEELEQLADRKAQLRLAEQERDFWMEAEKRQSKAIQKREEELKEQLYVQAEAHTQHLSDALCNQADQLETKWARHLETRLMEQQSYYQTELMRAIARLRGIEEMVDTIANAGEKTHQQQSLRTACDTLSATLEQADLKMDPSERYSFMKEISSLREAAHGDRFILSVLDSIPPEAVRNEQGIQSEAGLRQRFKRVKEICKRVALVPDVGGGLGTYALSYLHSLLAIDVWKHRNAADLQKEPPDMDTFDLVQQADNLLRKGDVEGAIRFVNCLRGEPRHVARDWLRDAQLHLETKQAIQLVQNYMAAISLSFIQ